jgi:hypothetical protein
MPSVNEGTDAATVDVNRTLESLHEAHNQSADTQELPQLRDTDFEAQIQQDSLSRKRQREEISEQEAPLAKRSYLPFPHNYLAEYNQPTGIHPYILVQNLIMLMFRKCCSYFN